MEIIKSLIVAVIILSATSIQAQTSFLSDLKAMIDSPYQVEGVQAMHHSTFSVDNIDDESVLVMWESATVNGTYEVQRAEGNGEYEAIAQMDADGTSSFSFLDNEPRAEATYRLVHISRTGHTSLSEETYISLLPVEFTIGALQTQTQEEELVR